MSFVNPKENISEEERGNRFLIKEILRMLKHKRRAPHETWLFLQKVRRNPKDITPAEKSKLMILYNRMTELPRTTWR